MQAIIVVGPIKETVDEHVKKYTDAGFVLDTGKTSNKDIIIPLFPSKTPIAIHPLIVSYRTYNYDIKAVVLSQDWSTSKTKLVSAGLVDTEEKALVLLKSFYSQIFNMISIYGINYEMITGGQAEKPTELELSNREHKDDQSRLLHGLDKHYGNMNNAPMLFSRQGSNMWLEGMYKGCSAFLILGGPSFGLLDSKKLNNPGILTMGVNNSVKTFRPNLWTCVDDPTHFMKSIWYDPKITKFVPFTHAEKTIFDNEAWQETKVKVGDCPNVWFFRRNERFKADQFLDEDTFNWGGHSTLDGGRSVMHVAIRLLYYLGIRRVFLLGCDLNMSETTKYHFDQDRTEGSIKGNNSTYDKLIKRFEELKPIFDRRNFYVYNCNTDSKLRVFPFIEYEEAIRLATLHGTETERTAGLYDRAAQEKLKKKSKKKADA